VNIDAKVLNKTHKKVQQYIMINVASLQECKDGSIYANKKCDTT
jgi:hypothetical protein